MSRQDVFVGAALQYWRDLFGGVAVEIENAPAVTSTTSLVIKGNGDRLGLLMMNLGSSNIFVAVSSQVSSTLGILLGANGGFVSMNVRDDFTLQTREWYAVAPSGPSSTLYTLELSRTGAPKGPPR